MVRLAAALSELGIGSTDPKVRENGVFFTMVTEAGRLDFLNDHPGADDYDRMRSRARQANAGGVSVWVVGYDDLIRFKEGSGREQALLGIHQLQSSRPECND